MKCTHCQHELREGDRFCVVCGAPASPSEVDLSAQEQTFLENTRRLLRWEQKAWRIEGIVFLVIGIVFALLFGLLAGAASLIPAEEAGDALFFIFALYAVMFGGMFAVAGIIGLIAAKKIGPYLTSFDVAPHAALTRCNSIGMLVFTCIFGSVSPVFFIINFVRMRASRQLVERINSRPRRQYFK